MLNGLIHTSVANEELDDLFAEFSVHDGVLLAVSGGRDSMALLVLADAWRRDGLANGLPRPAIRVATIDHGLRPEAAVEAAFVTDVCERLNVPHTAQTITAEQPLSGVQAWARDVRYRALLDLARANGCTAIATGHQSEDQAETLLMRLARGSGLTGLAAMQRARKLDELTLLRPLLNVSRQRLTESLRERNVQWVDDPSNGDARFERSVYAAHTASLEALGLTPPALTLTARRLRDASDALSWVADQTLADMTTCTQALRHAMYGRLPRSMFDRLPVELRRRLLQGVMETTSGLATSPRLDRLEALVERLAARDHVKAAFTLGGCLIVNEGDHIGVYREPGRGGFPEFTLQPGTSAIWDGRFNVAVPTGLDGPVQVRALPDPVPEPVREMLEAKLQSLPRRARAAIPAFWLADTLVAVPQLGHALAPFRIQNDVFERTESAADVAPGAFVSISTYGLPRNATQQS